MIRQLALDDTDQCLSKSPLSAWRREAGARLSWMTKNRPDLVDHVWSNFALVTHRIKTLEARMPKGNDPEDTVARIGTRF